MKARGQHGSFYVAGEGNGAVGFSPATGRDGAGGTNRERSRSTKRAVNEKDIEEKGRRDYSDLRRKKK